MLAVFLSPVVLACSGPGAMEFINSNILKSMLFAKVAAVFVVAMWSIFVWQRRKFTLMLCICASVLFAVHPAWTMGAMHGDCGIAKLTYSKFFAIIIGMAFMLQLYWLLFKRTANSTVQSL